MKIKYTHATRFSFVVFAASANFYTVQRDNIAVFSYLAPLLIMIILYIFDDDADREFVSVVRFSRL
jgi:uncharacterized membrane protein YoaK (UPF0700 family)